MKKFWCRKCGDPHGSFHKCFLNGDSRRFKTQHQMINLDVRPISERLLARLKEMPELKSYINDSASCQRLYSSAHDRFEGAWSWRVKMNGTIVSIGSSFSMAQCLSAKVLGVSDSHPFDLYVIE